MSKNPDKILINYFEWEITNAKETIKDCKKVLKKLKQNYHIKKEEKKNGC